MPFIATLVGPALMTRHVTSSKVWSRRSTIGLPTSPRLTERSTLTTKMQATLLMGTALVGRRLKLARSKGQPRQAHKAPPGRLAPRPGGVQQAAQRRAVVAPASTE